MDVVNIVMATYNGEKYIKEQLDSIIGSTYTNWTLNIFDDGSTDKTCSIINKYVEHFPDKIKLIKNEKNKGVTKNFLSGVISYDTNSDVNNYYMFCDQDDVWMKNKIERTLKVMKQLEKKYGDYPLTVFTDTTVVDENLNVLEASFFKTSGLNPHNTKLASVLMENKLIGCSVMFNEKVREKITTLPTEIRFHDWWIALITATFGYIYFLNEPTLYYRQHSNNVVGNKDFKGYVKNSILSLEKQKEAIIKTMAQGEAFYSLYKSQVPMKQKRILYTFSNLNKYGWLKKRYMLIKYGFLKTGIIRNIGLLFMI